MVHRAKDTYFHDFISGRLSRHDTQWLYALLERALLEHGVRQQDAQATAKALQEEIETALDAREEAIAGLSYLDYLDSHDQVNTSADVQGFWLAFEEQP